MLTSKCLIVLAAIYLVVGTTPSPQIVIGDPSSTKVQAPTFERVVHVPAPSGNDSRYMYIPFDVPPHAVRISVTYQYDRANGANTIDIGLFDARSTGSDTDPRGFRGWSGGRRSEFFISRDEATPGYMPGKMPAGRWRIILGLYRVAPAGVDVSLKVTIETAGSGSSRPNAELRTPHSTTRALPTPVADSRGSLQSSVKQKAGGHGARWWAGDLHMHTVHSDGNWTVAELISSARQTGLDFIVITDHNTASHHEEIDRLGQGFRQPLVLRGEEITTYGGHTNAWGLPAKTWIDFRTHPGDEPRISQIAAAAHRAGALVSINHPFALCGGCAWSYDVAARNFDAIEVWNGPWDLTDEPALKMWDRILQSGRRITAIASSDSHRPDTPIGKPATHVAAATLNQPSLLEAMRQGHAYLSDGTTQVVLDFAAEVATGRVRTQKFIGDEIRLRAPGTVRFFITANTTAPNATVAMISNGQTIRSFPAGTVGQPQVIEIDCRRDSYFRLEVRDGTNAMLALTNPIYVKVAKRSEQWAGRKQSNVQSPMPKVRAPNF
ncbi:MAG: CehA/McbA family metallohydrolase [Pyrinomonadaceae bacterium]